MKNKGKSYSVFGKGKLTHCLGTIGFGLLSSVSYLNADTFDESTLPTGDFANEFSMAFDLPLGTDEVIGATPTSDEDFFTFELTPGAEAEFNIFLDDTNRAFDFFDSLGNELLLDFSDNGGGGTFQGSFFVPAGGEVVTRFFDGNVSGNYRLTLSVSSVPEPSSSAILMLGAAGLLSTRRRWK